MNERYGIYWNETRVWGGFKSLEQAEQFISYYDLTENIYTVQSYNL